MIVVVRRRFVGLNGLKGIALIAIVLYHCDQGTLRGGFLGVDIFFTISGFLIFSSLLNHIDSGKGIGFKEYYLKRLRRIYPALILMIPVTVSLAWFINQDMLVDINNQIVTAMLGCYNWYAIGSGASYFSQMNPDMFRHLWFMSVLMQFYLLAPLLIYLLRKILVRWMPVAVLAGLAVCSALSMGLQYHPGTDPTRVYFGSDTHAMGLWLGAMLAWLLMIIRRGNGRPEETAIMERACLVWSKIGPAAAFVALLILLWMMQHVEQGPDAFYGGIFAASLLSVVLIAGSIPFGSWMQDLLVFKPFDVVGRYSYGIYLWHWPLWLFTKTMFPQWGARHLGWMLLITLALTACCTAMSWKLVEQPVARGGFIAMIRPLPENGMWDVTRCWITIAVVLSTCLMSGYAVANAPKQTSVERALEENAKMLKEQQGMHLDFDRKHPPAPKKPAYTMPDGQQMVAFGDSVMLASSKGLQSVFPGITVDAETSRSMTKALGLIDQAKSQPEGLRQWVLVGLATNSAVTDGQLNDILNDIGPDHVLVLINAHAPVSWVPGTNDALSNFAAAHSDNVVLVDWDATISAHPDELAGDGIHPGMSNTLYAQAVKDAIANWIKQGH
ncbi:acyltransferase family protein [Bifidobacterium pseudocatenulatum]|uniref:acyltransferase family protein n=1 Tax=Bifidobacterium pseudocatenulatum TaxID=28026 RepID=UPI001CFED317|nr:acyltransferase family protein [Bifidobacterium pseudocatenulatum]MCB4910495.1 acetyltransferase [Bifidobacterium pseudocatenulatum]